MPLMRKDGSTRGRIRSGSARRSVQGVRPLLFNLLFSLKFNTRQALNALIFPLEGPSTEIACKLSNACVEIGTRSGPLSLLSRRVLRYRDMDSSSELAPLLSYFFLVFTNVIVVSLRLLAPLSWSAIRICLGSRKLYSLRTSVIHPTIRSQPRITWSNSSIDPIRLFYYPLEF